MIALVLAVVTGLWASLIVGAGVAHAAPVYQIDGRWEASTPETVGSGDVVTGVWRVNVNDDQPAPSNDPVDNVTFEVTVGNALFKVLPDACQTGADFDPESAISEDGRTLTCNLGTVDQGTAVVVQTPVVADGETGDQITATGTIEDQTAPLDPIEILNDFAMDMHFGQNTGVYRWNETTTGLDLDIQWSLRLGAGSDRGPDEVTYRLDLSESNGGAVTVGNHIRGGAEGCTPFEFYFAEGHPWSELPGYPADQQTSFVDECILTPAGPNAFDLTLRGINYDLLTVPTKDSTNKALPTDWSYVASGSLWFHVAATQAGSVTLSANTPTYTSPVGDQTYTDPADNNATNKAYTLPGSFSAGWERPNGGNPWDDTLRMPAGATVQQAVTNALGHENAEPNTPYGDCLALDTRYVTYVPGGAETRAYNTITGAQSEIEGATLEYYIGNHALVDPNSDQYNPDTFNCGSDEAGWTETEPTDPSTVRAVRITYPFSTFDTEDADYLQLYVDIKINDDVEPGQDIWAFGSALHYDGWIWPGTDVTDTPDARYPETNTRRDILRVVFATPAIQKATDRSVVSPGEPATFTLTYSANGAGTMPPTVDDYQIVDTLPLGMTYVEGSANPADPAPEVSTDGEGRQVLTWNLDGVPSNVPNTLTYQAFADESVTPGQALTNTATSSLEGETSRPAAAQVTVATNGYTQIGKAAEQWFINNPDGSGDGEGSWVVTLRSFDPLPQAFTDTIDILPYNGDGRGTEFAGSYDVASVEAAAGATVYYTTADPADLSDDPDHDSNGSAGDVSGNTVGWSTDMPENPTAIRVIGPELAPGATQWFRINIETDGADPGDVWVNRAQARTGHTELVMRTSAPITMGSEYSASLKKYIQDANGDWHDANDVSDYPTFNYGDDLRYRIVVENTGQGTLTDVEVTDDKNPDLGNFLIDSLAPGETETHEYTVELTEDQNLTDTVNTACATADMPEDSDEPAAINCDPAGFIVTNYVTEKTSDPEEGTPVGPGGVINYTIAVTQQGPDPVTGAMFSDDLSDVLDDAVYNDDVEASTGNVEYEDGVLGWTGDLEVGEVATITYSVTVKDVADMGDQATHDLFNPVTSPGCAVVDGETPDCQTDHKVGWFTYSKVSDPATDAPVKPGDVVTYTLTVNQQGPGAVPGASIDDDLTDVIDDGTYNDDATASAGQVAYADGELTWTGDLAVDDVVTITYTVTVTEGGDDDLINPVGTTDDRGSCDEAVGCEVTHLKGRFVYSKVSDPESGATVEPGETITYTVTVQQEGKAPIDGATLTDDLSGVLDDAEYNGDVQASTGEATVEGESLAWEGDLEVGATETITYSVTVTDSGDDHVINEVTSDDERGRCDEEIGCQVEQLKGRFVYSKTSDPELGSSVQVGDTVTYTITVGQQGPAAVDGASITDDLSKVLDDAEYNGDVEASTGEATVEGDSLSWTGDLDLEQVATITYSVTVINDGDSKLANVVSSDDPRGTCDEAIGCQTDHLKGQFTYSKTSDPESGSTVEVGDTITYTVNVAQSGPGAVNGVSITDDMAKVLDDATYNGDVKASAGKATVNGDTLTWTGDLAVKAEVTVTYSVTVIDDGDSELANVVVADDPRGICDEQIGCQTEHQKADSDDGAEGDDGIAGTGASNLMTAIGGLGLLLVFTGALALAVRRRSVGGLR